MLSRLALVQLWACLLQEKILPFHSISEAVTLPGEASALAEVDAEVAALRAQERAASAQDRAAAAGGAASASTPGTARADGGAAAVADSATGGEEQVKGGAEGAQRVASGVAAPGAGRTGAAPAGVLVLLTLRMPCSRLNPANMSWTGSRALRLRFHAVQTCRRWWPQGVESRCSAPRRGVLRN